MGQFRLRDQPELAALRRDLLEKADEFYTELLSRPDANPSLLIERAQVRRELHRVEEDLADLLQLLEQQPDNPQLHVHLAHVYRGTGKLDDAVKHAERATQLAPLNPQGWYQLAWSHAASRAFSLAATAMRRAVELTPDPPGIAFKTACALEFEKSFEQAAVQFHEAAHLMGPVAYEAWLREGHCWLRCNELENSLAALNACIEQNAFNPRTWDLRAHVHDLMGSKEQAMQDSNRALSLDPNYEASLMRVLQYHLAAKDYPEAIQLLQSRTGTERADIALLRSRSWTAIETSGNTELLSSRDALLERILQKFPISSQPDRYIELARITTDPQRVIKTLDDRLPSVDDDVEARLRWLRGHFLVRAKRWQSAIRDFESALTHESTPARLNEAAWLLALPPDLASYESALGWARRAASEGEHPRYFNTLALTLLRAKEHESALATLVLSIQHPFAYPVNHAWDHLIKALTLSELERWDETADAMKVAEAKAPRGVRESADWQQLLSEIRSNLERSR